MPKKILLADDSITIQKVVELTFSDGDYEVTAVNNGSKAIQKLTEMRPDIILSDIIMPEKNGYEVCEFVKSHPEYRNIPVVLLTGTFEPFDPDRADKAGCDAVVTKPFESQSLIHKVEELIEQARSNAPTMPTPAMSESVKAPAGSSPWSDDSASPSSFTPAASEPATHDNDIFGAPPAAEQFSGETRAFPKMSFDDMPKEPTTQQMPAQTPPPPPAPAPAPTPWNEPPAGETRAFPRMSFEEMDRPATPPPPPPAPPSAATSDSDSPFGASPSADSFSGETRAFPKMNFDEMPQPEAPKPGSASQEHAPSPWDEPPVGETRAFPRMNFDDMAEKPAASSKGSSSSAPWGEPEKPSDAAWSSPSSAAEEVPFDSGASSSMAADEEPAWTSPAVSTPPPSMSSQPSSSSSASSSSSSSNSGNGMDLTDDQVDRIARRVVQMMSDQVVRNIAWEVIPDLAEMVVKERIRQLEAE